MRSFQVFAAMSSDDAIRMLRTLADKMPAMFDQAVAAASASMKARPVYLKRQPFEKRAVAVRRALSRFSANVVADELLAVYFLECRKELLTEWLDLVGLEHEDGTLADDEPASPADDALTKAIAAYRAKDDDADREILLHAFAAQQAIDWPVLDAAFDGGG